ncbi:hypothetical protein [Pedobacter sp. NJ-S-72]
MKKALVIFILLIAVTAGAGIQKAAAQCAMCTIQVLRAGDSKWEYAGCRIKHWCVIPDGDSLFDDCCYWLSVV